MTRRNTTRLATLALLSAALVISGCQTDTGTDMIMGAASGAGAGAIIGKQMLGHTVEGALIGAGVGAAAGYIIGNASDREKASDW